MLGNMPEIRRLGLENLPGEPGNIGLVITAAALVSTSVRGPRFFSDGKGFNESISISDFCFKRSFSRALSAAARALSLLTLSKLQGLMLTWKPLLAEACGSGSASILIDNFIGSWNSEMGVSLLSR